VLPLRPDTDECLWEGRALRPLTLVREVEGFWEVADFAVGTRGTLGGLAPALAVRDVAGGHSAVG
jgi:hypothetical protein